MLVQEERVRTVTRAEEEKSESMALSSQSGTRGKGKTEGRNSNLLCSHCSQKATKCQVASKLSAILIGGVKGVENQDRNFQKKEELDKIVEDLVGVVPMVLASMWQPLELADVLHDFDMDYATGETNITEVLCDG
ncbi:hypothetical protein V2J09_017738 [Rumex salicifolius]